MHRGHLARIAVVLALVVAPLAPIVLAEEPPEPRRQTTEHLDERLARLVADSGAPAGAADDRWVNVLLTLKGDAEPPASVDPDQVITRADSRLVEAEVPVSAIGELANHPRFESVRIDGEWSLGNTRVADGVAAIGATALHARGLTGESVSVGVIGSGFHPGDAEIAPSVAAYRPFDGTGADWRHGTAVASVVADVAPDADLHLAAVGRTTTREEYAAAVEWLEARDVDVIIDAGSYFGPPGDDGIETIAATVAADTLFVTSAGNYARRHWQGVHDASSGEGWVSVAGERQGNFLNDGDAFAGRVRVGLQWNGTAPDDAYALYLLRRQWGEDEVMAVATGGGYADLRTRVPRGRYYVAIRDVNASGVTRVEVFANRVLSHRSPAGSITAPGTVESAFVVGALEDGTVASYSSRGAVDAVAPASVALSGVTDTNGTSYAAPYAAGLAALLYQEYELSPGATAAVLRESAVDVGPPGVDAAAGHGRLDAMAAYRLAAIRSRYRAVNASV